MKRIFRKYIKRLNVQYIKSQNYKKILYNNFYIKYTYKILEYRDKDFIKIIC